MLVQGEECRRMAERLRKLYPDSDTPSLIEAAQYWREKQVAKATDLLTVSCLCVKSLHCMLRGISPNLQSGVFVMYFH